MEFKHAKLDNGLNVVAEVNPAAASLAVGFFARTGSRDETPEVSGVSHFLEHMVFKGTPRRSPAAVNLEFDEMGARYNASTSYESTIYYGEVLPEFQSRLVDLLSDIMRPSLRQEDFDVEKNVILEEIALYEDQPKFRTYDNLMSEFFGEHPLGNRILGTPESIRAMKRDDMQAYFDRRYSPGNVTAVGVGSLDFDAFVADVRRACSAWTPFGAERDTPPTPRRQSKRDIRDEKLVRQHVGLMSPAPPVQDDARFAAQVLGTILGDETGSRLYYALVEPAIADEAVTMYDPLDHAGGFITFVSADPDNAARAVEIVEAEYRRFMDEGPTNAELDAAKNKIATGATLRGEVPMGRLGAVGMDWVYRGEYVPLREQIERMLAVTRGDVMAVAGEYDLRAMTRVSLGPRESL